MGWHRELAKFAALLRRRKPADDFAEEIRAHLEMEAQENRESGMSPEEAYYAARRRFGNVLSTQERSREMWRWPSFESIGQDVRYGFRQLRQSPGFTVVAVLTLALGIGANTAVFSLAHAAFFRAFPFPHAERLAFLWQDNSRTGETEGAVSYPNYADWRAQSRTFEDMAFVSFGKIILTGSGTETILPGPDGAERVPSALVSTNFFSVLGVSPALGRGFVPDDAAPDHTSVVVLSYGLWQERFGGDPHILGSRLKVGGGEETIIGVAPPGFVFPEKTQFWAPRVVNGFLQTKARQYPNLAVIGRRRPEVSWSHVQAEMNALAGRLANEYPNIDGGVGIRVVPLREQLSERVRAGIFILWGAILGVLLMACLNTAGLLIGRASARQKEIAVRLSLGATRWRLARQLIAESMFLATTGALWGVGLALAVVRLVAQLNPDIGRLDGRVLDLHVLGYTAAVTALSALLCGVVPIFVIPHVDVNRALKESSAAISPATHATRRIFIVAEVATAFVLLVGSCLLMRSLWGVLRVDPGFDADHVLAFHLYWLDQPKNSGESSARAAQTAELLGRLTSLPGVSSIASASFVLFPDEMYKVPCEVEGPAVAPSEQKPLLLLSEASPDFFRTMGIPLRRGREFSAWDAAKDAQPVAVINQSMVRRLWPAEDPLNKRFKTLDPNFKSVWFTVVGVVGDVRGEGLETAVGPMAYIPSTIDVNDDIVIRSTGDPDRLSNTVRREVRAFDKNVLVDHVASAKSQLDERESPREFAAWLLVSFAFAALVLAAVGIYGVLAYWVGQRTREIGVRMALGATRNEALRLVMRQGLNFAIAGILLGGAAAAGLTRYIASSLYGVQPIDPLSVIAVGTLLLGVSALASYIPARRATEVDPTVALRHE